MASTSAFRDDAVVTSLASCGLLRTGYCGYSGRLGTSACEVSEEEEGGGGGGEDEEVGGNDVVGSASEEAINMDVDVMSDFIKTAVFVDEDSVVEAMEVPSVIVPSDAAVAVGSEVLDSTFVGEMSGAAEVEGIAVRAAPFLNAGVQFASSGSYSSPLADGGVKSGRGFHSISWNSHATV